MKNYKVCILAAGAGGRMGALTDHINKAGLPINFKAAISYIVEKFSKDTEIVIAVGHKKDTVIDYLTIAHPDRKFNFVEVDRFVGPGTGPGYSLLQCKSALQCPFIFFAADTIVLEEVPVPDKNWFGIAPVKETEPYCTVKIKNNLIYQLDDKVKTDNKFAFIGLAGVYDYESFFTALEKDKESIKGEIQVSNGFKSLIEKQLVPVGFTWFDTGSLKNYVETSKSFAGGEKKFDFSKGDEFLYFVNDRVIKYFADPEIVKKRCERAELLKGLCPKIEVQRGNFYAYKKVDGNILYSLLNTQVAHDFFQWLKRELWKPVDLSDSEKKEFENACKVFYKDKTLKRLEKFYSETNIQDIHNIINGIAVPPLQELLEKVNWDSIFQGIPVRFHGDLQFDNVLVSRDPMSNLQKFILLDWRHDFGGFMKAGDLYYDLAKLYGGMIISYQLIKEGMFSFDMSGASVYYNHFVKNDIVEAKEEFELFLKKNNFDLNKIRTLTSLIFLNMAPLHKDPFNFMLYFMGKSMLYKCLMQKEELRAGAKNG
ncbi:NTP transferase domain-containing protein [Candidatus Pacearchaeota archaeon]|nr:NTP transferase domain-containing protein [Candidatus Pacearchaeota archaeon]